MGSSGIKKDALGQFGTNQSTAAGALNTVNPIYGNLASGTVGYTPTQKANQLTSSAQSLGGGVAGAVGQGGLLAARTGNAGGAAAALDDASRQAGVQQGANALDVQNASDQLATQNQRVGLAGLNSIYSGSNQQANANLGAASSAPAPFGQQLALGAISALGQGAGAIAKACWVAAELYGGWYEPRTVAVRGWIFGPFSETRIGKFFANLYLKHGESLAEKIKVNKSLRWCVKKVFDAALRRAVK